MPLRHLEAFPDGRLLLVAEDGERAIALRDLPDGEWRLGEEVAEGATPPPAVSAGGRRFVFAAERGGLVVRAAPLAPWAEAERIAIDGSELVVRADPAGELTAIRDGQEVRGATGRLDLAQLGEGVWELYAGGRRIARHRDGIAGKARLVRLPSWEAARPVFTAADQLSVRVGKAAEPPPAAPATTPRVSLRRRLLGAPAVAAHRVALALVRVMPRRRGGSAEPTVRFVIANAYGLGGTIRATFTLAAALAEQVPVEIVSVRRHGRRTFFAPPAGVAMIALDDRTQPSRLHERLLRALPSLLVHPDDYAYPGASLLSDARLVRALRRSGGDVVVTTRPAYAIVAAAVAPPTATVIAQEHMNFGAHRPRLARAVRRSLRDVDAVTVLTEGDRSEYGAALAGSRARVVHLPDPLAQLSGGPADPAARVVVAAGRLTRQKGFDLLIRAFAPVVAAHDDWRLRIYGGGPERAALAELIARLGLHDHATLMGPTRHIGEALATGSVFALSSRFEGFGMVLVEAMSRGLAVVSFDCPRGPGEIVRDGDSGLLVPAGDVDGLSAALARLAADEDLRRQLAAAGLRRAADYSPRSVAERWRALLDDLRRPV